MKGYTMQTDTLLGHLALSFSEHPENLATRALGFILQRSANAQNAVARLLRQCGVIVPDGLVYRNQSVGDDDTIPDLVGVDEKGRECVIVEAKFWAGLTENQPCGYLKRLPQESPAALVFVAPARRAEPLWAELVGRCTQQIQQAGETPMPGVKSARLAAQHRLLLISWKTLLTFVAADLDAAGDLGTASDVRQLDGLCDRMDSDAFLPVRPEEFAPEIPRRIRHLIQLVDVAAQSAVAAGFASKKTEKGSLRRSARDGSYGTYMLFGDVGVCLWISYKWWANLYPTPLWLEVFGKDWSNGGLLRGKLPDFEYAVPPRLFFSGGGNPLVPLTIPFGKEKDEVLKELVDQLRTIAERLTQPD